MRKHPLVLIGRQCYSQLPPHCGGYSFQPYRTLDAGRVATENYGRSLSCGASWRYVHMRDSRNRRTRWSCLLRLPPTLHHVVLWQIVRAVPLIIISVDLQVRSGLQLKPANVHVQRLLCDHAITAHAPRKQIFDGEGHACREVENVFTSEIAECEEARGLKERAFISPWM